MTVGTPLFKRENDIAMMYAVIEERHPAAVVAAPRLPRDLEAVIMKALERREDGYTTPLDSRTTLRRLARDNGWDIEAQALAELVQQELPDDQIAFGRIGSDAFSGGGPPSRSRTTFGDAVEPDSFASVEVVPTRSYSERRALLATSIVMIV